MTSFHLSNVSVVYRQHGGGEITAVDGVDLTARSGEIVGLIGESGSGKSSLGRVGVALQRPTGGDVTLDGRRLKAFGSRRPRSDLALQMVFQNPASSFNPRRTIGRQLRDAARARTNLTDDVEEVVTIVCAQVDLPTALLSRYPHQCSGGQLQRLAIARVLAVDPKIIVMDEPFSSLDPSAQAHMARTIRRLVDELQLAIIVISHDLQIVRTISDRVAVMYAGRMVELGQSQQVWQAPGHPYTEALIAAVPEIKNLGMLPTQLQGEIHDSLVMRTGCRFAPRCKYAFAKCHDVEPKLLRITDSHSSACWLREEPGSGGESTADGEATNIGAGENLAREGEVAT